MRFLIDEDLPRSIIELLQRYGHEGVDLLVIGRRGSTDRQIAAFAQDKGLCLVISNRGFRFLKCSKLPTEKICRNSRSEGSKSSNCLVHH